MNTPMPRILALTAALLIPGLPAGAHPSGAQEPALESGSEACAALLAEALENGILELEQSAFDQTMDGGWRPIADAGCYAEAAGALDRYVAMRPAQSEAAQATILRFHAGQMYGFVGRTPEAIERFTGAVYSDELLAGIAADDPDTLRNFRSWNAYVRATIAFLEQNAAALAEARQFLADNQDLRINAINLPFVDRFVARLGEPYGDVYRGRGADEGAGDS